MREESRLLWTGSQLLRPGWAQPAMVCREEDEGLNEGFLLNQAQV
jgi:hypothetical protein